MRKISTFLMFFVLLVWGSQINGQINISVGNSISENFNIGTDAVSTMPTNWKVDKNNAVRTLGSYSAALSATEKSGGNSMAINASNGIYNFAAGDPATEVDRAIGGLSSGSASKSVNVYTQLKNNGLTEIPDFTISYNVEKYRNGSNAAGFSIQMYYSTDGTTWTSAGSDFLSSFAADADNEGYAVAPGSVVNITSKTLSVPVSAEGFLYLAWNYSVTSGTTSPNAQALGIDDVSITANSSVPLEDFDVTYSVVGTNGTLTATVDAAPITSPASVQEGKDVIFTAAPAVGYQVKEWKLNSVLVAGNTSNTYTLSNIDADADVSVEFEEISTTTFAVSFAVVNGNGDLTATVDDIAITSPEDVLEGNDVVFTAAPAVGYQVKEWRLNTVLVAGNTTTNYTLTDVSAISNVSVEFEMLPTYTITFTVKNASDVDITNAVITFNGVANPEGDYIFNNIAAGTYDYSVDAPSYQSVIVNGFVVTETATIAVVLQNEPIASLPIDYSGPWQNGLPAGWTQSGLGSDYTSGAAKFDSSGDMLKVHFDQEPGLLIYSIKGNTSGSVSWDGTFEIMESVDGSTWTSVESYSGIGEIDHTAYTSFTHNLLPTTRIVKWVYTEKITGNVGLENVIITLPLQDFDVTFDVVGAHGTLSATVDAAPITSPASVQEGKDVVFTAVPAVDYQVKEWKLNNVVVSANTSNTYTLSALNADADVSVEFEAIPEPITHVVNFSVVGANGTLIAKVEGVEISTGDLVEEGNDVVFTATPENGYRVKEWTLNSTIVPANTSNEYTVTNIMSETNVNVEFELDGTGISENNSIFLSIYPNPSNGVFSIDSDGLYTLEVLDMQGRLMVRRSLENGLNVLDINAFANGIYLVRVNNANHVYTTRISKSE